MNRVHPPSDSQADVFSVIQPLIVSLLDGSAFIHNTACIRQLHQVNLLPFLNRYNVCIMAYGQTGSGKTHTMLGPLNKAGSEGDCGVLPCAVRELFRWCKGRIL